jgi:hypothetical protein
MMASSAYARYATAILSALLHASPVLSQSTPSTTVTLLSPSSTVLTYTSPVTDDTAVITAKYDAPSSAGPSTSRRSTSTRATQHDPASAAPYYSTHGGGEQRAEDGNLKWGLAFAVLLASVIGVFAFLTALGRRRKLKILRERAAASASLPSPSGAGGAPASAEGIAGAAVRGRRVGAAAGDECCWEDPPPPYEATPGGGSSVTENVSMAELLPVRATGRVSPAPGGLPELPPLELTAMGATVAGGAGTGRGSGVGTTAGTAAAGTSTATGTGSRAGETR